MKSRVLAGLILTGAICLSGTAFAADLPSLPNVPTETPPSVSGLKDKVPSNLPANNIGADNLKPSLPQKPSMPQKPSVPQINGGTEKLKTPELPKGNSDISNIKSEFNPAGDIKMPSQLKK